MELLKNLLYIGRRHYGQLSRHSPRVCPMDCIGHCSLQSNQVKRTPQDDTKWIN